MIIGVDIDGVLTDLLKSIKKEYKKFAKLKNGNVAINKKAKSLSEYFGVSREQDDEFFKNYNWIYAENAKYYKSAKKYINLLRSEGHKVYIVTARAYAGEDNELGERMRYLVESSLKNEGVCYDKIFYTSKLKNKLPVIEENGIDVFIDDAYWNIEALSSIVPVICYSQVYNSTYYRENLMRAKNWKEVYKHIKNLNKEVV
ncbi:MAG: hypothetical protein IJX25_01395 [Clostridia bacterium]|nr:hypothetical protein [Clostridia bacterium]MBQ8792032.1 hypothetical protein [Clostridia bacterium]